MDYDKILMFPRVSTHPVKYLNIYSADWQNFFVQYWMEMVRAFKPTASLSSDCLNVVSDKNKICGLFFVIQSKISVPNTSKCQNIFPDV